MLNDSKEGVYQRKLALNVMVEQEKYRKHMIQIMAVLATGFFNLNQNNRGYRED